MNDEEILLEIQSIFGSVLGRSDLILHSDSSADDIAEWDSLNHATLIVGVQNHFKLRFSLDEVIHLKTVGDLVALVSASLAK